MTPEEQKNLEYQTAVVQLDQKTKALKPHLQHHLLVVTTLLIFPPVAFYLMWKYKDYHYWFASLSWISGAFLLLYTLILNFGILPQVQNVIRLYGNGTKVTLDGGLILLLLFLSITQIILGFYLKYVYMKRGDLTKVEMAICIALFGLGYIVPGIVYNNIVTPIYDSVLG